MKFDYIRLCIVYHKYILMFLSNTVGTARHGKQKLHCKQSHSYIPDSWKTRNGKEFRHQSGLKLSFCTLENWVPEEKSQNHKQEKK